MNDLYRTEERIYARVQPGDNDNTIMRYEKSTDIANSYFSHKFMNEILAHAHPIEGRANGKMACPHQDYSVHIDAPLEKKATHTTSINPKAIWLASNAIGVSDGSLHPLSGRAVYAWVTATERGRASIKRSNEVKVNPKYMTSYSYRANFEWPHNLFEYLVENRNINFKLWYDSEGVLKTLSQKKDRTSLVSVKQEE